MSDLDVHSLIRRAHDQYTARVALGLFLALIFGAVLGYAGHELAWPPGAALREPCPAGFAPQQHKIMRWPI